MQRIKESRTREYIGSMLRKKRIEKDISQVELGVATDLSRTFINLVENAKRTPSYNSLEKMATYLGVSLEKLIAEVEEGDHDPEIRLPYLMAKLLKSRDREKLTKLLYFIESLG